MGKTAISTVFIQNCIGSVLLFRKFGKMVLSFDASGLYFVPDKIDFFLAFLPATRFLRNNSVTMAAKSLFSSACLSKNKGENVCSEKCLEKPVSRPPSAAVTKT
jgi:hypothetical protein